MNATHDAAIEDIVSKVKEWDKRMSAAPSFEEIRDVEWIRRSGRINMLIDGLQRELYDSGRYAGVVWLERCKKHRQTWTSYWDAAMASYEAIHGPRDTWFPRELTDAWQETEILEEEGRLERRLADLKSRRRAKSKPGAVM
jgi:hypothetical protein